MNFRSTIDELEKLGAITPEQAEEALDRLEALERNKPTLGQVLRYSGLGAVAVPAITATSDIIRGQKPFKPVEVRGVPIRYGRLRAAAGSAVSGALTSGAIPLVRSHLDRAAEKRKLKQFLAEYEKGQLAKKAERAGKAIEAGKEKDGDLLMNYEGSYDPGSFRVSQYSGPLSYGSLVLPSLLSQTPDQPLNVTVERKKQAASLIPAVTNSVKSKLTLAQKVGQPKLTNPAGPSIADIAKPRGFGLPLPGALKGTI
jgi:hypothetical protein